MSHPWLHREARELFITMFNESLLKLAGPQSDEMLAGERAVRLFKALRASRNSTRFSILLCQASHVRVNVFANRLNPAEARAWRNRFGVPQRHFREAVTLIRRAAKKVAALNGGESINPKDSVPERRWKPSKFQQCVPRDPKKLGKLFAQLSEILACYADFAEDQYEWTLDNVPWPFPEAVAEAELILFLKRITGKPNYQDVGTLLKVGTNVVFEIWFSSEELEREIQDKALAESYRTRAIARWRSSTRDAFTEDAVRRRYQSMDRPLRRRGRRSKERSAATTVRT